MSKLYYLKRKESYEKLFNKQTKAANRISNLRLLVFLTGTASIIFLAYFKLYLLLVAILISTVTIFIYLIISHSKILYKRDITSSLININDNCHKRVNDDWKTFEDTGSEFVDSNHDYTYDLDIFGKSSLFQQINVTNTYLGRQKLYTILTSPLKYKEEILNRQEAVADLAKRLVFRQHFEAEGITIKKEVSNPNLLIDWAQNTNEFFLKRKVIAFFRIFPVITTMSLILSLTIGLIPIFIPVSLLLTNFIILKINSGKRSKTLGSVAIYKDNIKLYSKLLKQLETKKLSATYLLKLKNQLYNSNGKSASEQITRLSKIVDSISNRYNAYYFVLNILTLWDYQCLISLEQWKNNSGRCIKNWLDVIGEVEAISSLSVLKYDNPDWATPEISHSNINFRALSMGHPLLGKNKVCNSLEYYNPVNVILVTGSNMSGKSTFLRTAGINLLLALIGAPVCAESFSCSIMDIYTCMRVSDNLEQNISSFYAELLRIKRIVAATENNQKIFYLLDEIFKGTNSVDRHTGAKVLINKLSNSESLGMVSTHDLELGELESDNTKVKNYHFKEFYSNGEIHFDYKLRNGISDTRNAIYLMKMSGIDVI